MQSAVEEIAPNLYCVPIPLPHNPLKALNSYIVLDPEQTFVIDVGFDMSECKRALMDALETLGRPWNTVCVVATHGHPDHVGCLARLPKTTVPIYGGMSSFEEVNDYYRDEQTAGQQIIDKLAKGRAFSFADEFAMPNAHVDVRRIGAGDMLHMGRYDFEVLEFPGHDKWHICLIDRAKRLMIAGDHVLKKITPTISSWRPSCDALGDYQESLRRLACDDIDLALPGHGEPIADLAAERDRLLAHHDARLAEICDIVHDGRRDAIDIASHASWHYSDWQNWALTQQVISIGETLAHLIRLANEGRIVMHEAGPLVYEFLPTR